MKGKCSAKFCPFCLPEILPTEELKTNQNLPFSITKCIKNTLKIKSVKEADFYHFIKMHLTLIDLTRIKRAVFCTIQPAQKRLLTRLRLKSGAIFFYPFWSILLAPLLLSA